MKTQQFLSTPMVNTPSFVCFKPHSCGLLYETHDEFPLKVSGWSEGAFLPGDTIGTFYFFQITGWSWLTVDRVGSYPLREHMYASTCRNWFSLRNGKESSGFGIQHLGYKGHFTLGGPIEHSGRLRYIDGCTDTLLISPLRKGNPCLNALYFPKGVRQQSHTHPSIRIATVVSGSGECVTPHGTHPLEPGMILIVPPNAVHAFNTPKEAMTVITFHPDSDFGPEDKNHPVINRTLIKGVSAAKLKQ